MLTSQYDGQSGISEHIMSMCDIANKLKTLDMAISDDFLVHFIMTSLPARYSPFKISYNTQKATWSMAELISYCDEEEERQKAERMKDAINMVSERFGRVSMSNTPKHQAESGSSRQHKRNLRAIRARPCHIRRPLMRGCASSASHLNMSRRITMDLRSGLRTKV